MPDDSEAKADCYAEHERAGMVRFQQFKAWLLHPLLVALARYHVTGDHISVLSTVIGLAFCPLYFWSPAAAFGCLLGHLLLDGLDGPLARFRNIASRRGSFTDTMGDQTVVTATTITWMYTQAHPALGLPGIELVAGGTYIFLYTIVVAFAMIRNAMSIPYGWVLRPRNFVYGWLFLEAFLFTWPPLGFLAGSADYFVWFCNVVLAIKLVTGFVQIRNRL